MLSKFYTNIDSKEGILIEYEDEGFTYDGEVQSKALGRNGWMKCTGVYLIECEVHDAIVAIMPANSRGLSPSCRIEIPYHSVDKLINALIKMKKENLE